MHDEPFNLLGVGADDWAQTPAAERALRPALLWRKGCFGSRSADGCRFVERLLSVRVTCAVQGQALFAFLTAAVCAAWADQPTPTLVPSP
jgi:transposase